MFNQIDFLFHKKCPINYPKTSFITWLERITDEFMETIKTAKSPLVSQHISEM